MAHETKEARRMEYRLAEGFTTAAEALEWAAAKVEELGSDDINITIKGKRPRAQWMGTPSPQTWSASADACYDEEPRGVTEGGQSSG